jgi:hypothetical protein
VIHRTRNGPEAKRRGRKRQQQRRRHDVGGIIMIRRMRVVIVVVVVVSTRAAASPELLRDARVQGFRQLEARRAHEHRRRQCWALAAKRAQPSRNYVDPRPRESHV